MRDRDRRQTAVLWPVAGTDDYGAYTVGDPVELSVRWVFGRSEVLDPQGNRIAVDAQVTVDREIAIGSEMVKGTLSEWVGTGSAGDDDEVMMVMSYSEVPDVRARDFRRVVGLRYKADTRGASA